MGKLRLASDASFQLAAKASKENGVKGEKDIVAHLRRAYPKSSGFDVVHVAAKVHERYQYSNRRGTGLFIYLMRLSRLARRVRLASSSPCTCRAWLVCWCEAVAQIAGSSGLS